MAARSALRNRLRTKSAASASPAVADADPEAGELVGAEVGRDVAQPFLAAVGPARPEPELAQRQAEVIADDQEVGRLELVEPHRLADGAAAEIHERLGLQKQDAPVVDLDLGDQAVELAGERRPRPPWPADRSARSRCCAASPGTCCPGCPGRPPVSSSPTPRLPDQVDPVPTAPSRSRPDAPTLGRPDGRRRSIFLLFFLALGLDDFGLRRRLGRPPPRLGSASAARA